MVDVIIKSREIQFPGTSIHCPRCHPRCRRFYTATTLKTLLNCVRNFEAFPVYYLPESRFQPVTRNLLRVFPKNGVFAVNYIPHAILCQSFIMILKDEKENTLKVSVYRASAV